jgi:ATP-dependent Clp protease adapter protein ClpS
MITEVTLSSNPRTTKNKTKTKQTKPRSYRTMLQNDPRCSVGYSMLRMLKAAGSNPNNKNKNPE